MFNKSFRIGLIGLTLLTASAWAASSVLQGVVKDTNGLPIQGADIRIEAKSGGKLLQTVKTDSNGRYVAGGLPAGDYRVTLVVNGAVKTAINNTTIEAGELTRLNFDLAKTSASQPPRPAEKGNTGFGYRRSPEVVCLVAGSNLMTMEVGREKRARCTSCVLVAKNCNGQFTP